jgi:integrase
LEQREARRLGRFDSWSPSWTAARSLVVARARQGDKEPLRHFIRTALSSDACQAASLNYWAYWIGETAGLRRGRVDLERGTVQVIEVVTEPKGRLYFGPPKTSAGRRMVGLPRFVVDALAERMAAPGAAEDFVFGGPHGGVLRVTLFRQRFWLPAVKAAGLDGLRIHDLRHTAVALWIAAGANPKEVAARAGHASVSFTLDRYGHLYSEADLTLRERLDAIWSASGGGR